MKSKLLSLIGIAALLAMVTGCAGLARTGKLAGYAGTRAALIQHPEWRPGFVLAEQELAAIEAQETIDVTSVLAIMHRLPVKELHSETAVIVVETTTILVEEFGGERVSLNDVQTAELKKFLHRLREGIRLALGT